MLVHIVAEKLDPSTRKSWAGKTSGKTEPPSFDELKEFMEGHIRSLEEYTPSTSGKYNAKSASSSKVHAATAVTASHSACPICKARHYLSVCPAFLRGNPNQRRDIVKHHRRCFNCLSKNHAAHECKSKYSCRRCHKRHHTLLRAESDAGADSLTASPSGDKPLPQIEPQTETYAMIASIKLRTPAKVLLATAWIIVSVPSGRSLSVRALLDQGSEITFISENLAQLLRVKRIRVSTSVSAVGCVSAGVCRQATTISISPRDSFSPSLLTTALILKNLTAYTPKVVTDVSKFPHLMGLQWADPKPTNSD